MRTLSIGSFTSLVMFFIGASSGNWIERPGKSKSALETFRTIHALVAASTSFLVGLFITVGVAGASTQPQPVEPSGSLIQGGLTLEKRIKYQEAIERVYRRHRVWPEQNGKLKPDLGEVMPYSALRAKVEDYLGKSQALAVYWQRPITAEQLQAEMDRMASQTKEPAVLKELWLALGNDPYLIAECLARPALANRLIRNWYAYDERFHGELRRRAEGDLRRNGTRRQMRNTSGAYRELRWVRGDTREARDAASNTDSVTVNTEQWQANLRELARLFAEEEKTSAGISGDGDDATEELDRLPVEELSQLQEGEDGFYVTAVLGKSNEQIQVATLEWKKDPFDMWWKRQAERMNAPPEQERRYSYRLAAISSGPGTCVDDTWQPTLAPPVPIPSSRSSHTAVWTGSEMIVWGGYHYGANYLNTGERYDPATETWTPTSMRDAPSGRNGHTAVWTGSEMIVWGGSPLTNTGGRYDPASDTWTPTSALNAPSGRNGYTAVWTGNEMILWGGADYCDGYGCSPTRNTGGRYDPTSDTWAPTATANAPTARALHTAVWTGTEMIVWGGVEYCNEDACSVARTGGRYDPTANTWSATSTALAPSGRQGHRAVWTGSEMIAWGGADYACGGEFCYLVFLNTGGRYSPVTNSWIATSTTNAPSARFGHSAVWSGSEMIIWGGGGDQRIFNTGGRYNPGSDSWIATTTSNAPGARLGHTAVWSGSEMIVWGSGSNTGARYDPASDSWTATSRNNVPGARSSHTGVWTGNEMIIWGGIVWGGVARSNAGWRYDPAIDTWAPTATTNAPSGRTEYTAVWTGTEMIVWGGDNGFYLNTGGRYDPATDIWTPTNTTGAPSWRRAHTAVWTGTEMIVWGGAGGGNTGGRYHPPTDSWTSTSTTNAPSARYYHTAVWVGREMIVWGPGTNTGGRYDPATDSWMATSMSDAPSGRWSYTAVSTGSEMIVWGGGYGSSSLNTGGRYDPATDNWMPTSTNNAPSGRSGHTAVWTGSEMIVWGSGSNTGGRYDPATDSWIPTSTNNAPTARSGHTAVWTGREMIVWGGYTDTGGRYCASR